MTTPSDKVRVENRSLWTRERWEEEQALIEDFQIEPHEGSPSNVFVVVHVF